MKSSIMGIVLGFESGSALGILVLYCMGRAYQAGFTDDILDGVWFLLVMMIPVFSVHVHGELEVTSVQI